MGSVEEVALAQGPRGVEVMEVEEVGGDLGNADSLVEEEGEGREPRVEQLDSFNLKVGRAFRHMHVQDSPTLDMMCRHLSDLQLPDCSHLCRTCRLSMRRTARGSRTARTFSRPWTAWWPVGTTCVTSWGRPSSVPPSSAGTSRSKATRASRYVPLVGHCGVCKAAACVGLARLTNDRLMRTKPCVWIHSGPSTSASRSSRTTRWVTHSSLPPRGF